MLSNSVKGLEMFPMVMMRTDRASWSKGVVFVLLAVVDANYWYKQMESGLMERFRKTKKVSFLMRLRTLFVFNSCFYTQNVVNSNKFTTRKFPIKTTKFFPIETIKESQGKVLIQYCNKAPKMSMAKLIQQHAKRCAFLTQQSDYNCSQSMSYASGPAQTLMCCPLMAVEEQHVQNLKKSLPKRPFWYFLRNLSREFQSLNVTKTKSSLFSLFLRVLLMDIIYYVFYEISLLIDVMKLFSLPRFFAMKQVFFNLYTTFNAYIYSLTLKVNSTFYIGQSLNFCLISCMEAFLGTLVSMTLRSDNFLLRLFTQYLLFLRKPLTKRMREVNSMKQRKRISRRSSMKPIWMSYTWLFSGEVNLKDTVWIVGENMRCAMRHPVQTKRISVTIFTQLKYRGISGLILRNEAVPVQMGIFLVPTRRLQQGQTSPCYPLMSQTSAAYRCSQTMSKSGGIWYRFNYAGGRN